jgi:pimeloyl-ACP methyl ester carboxylesterase
MTPMVLIHGGGFDSRCWDLLLPFLSGPAVAVDLPGRGRRPAAPESVTFADCAQAVVEEVDAAGFDEVVLVGHSQAGCSLPRMMARLGDRVRHAVFVAALVPGQGISPMQELAPEVTEKIEEHRDLEQQTMDPAMAKIFFGNDLDDDQFAWCLERLVPEPPGLPNEPVDLSGLRSTAPRTWVRTTRDAILAPDLQLRFVERVGDCPVVDLDAGHMCMISQPERLAEILERIAS